jgi:hypothetical protein
MPCLENTRLTCQDIVGAIASGGVKKAVNLWKLDMNSMQPVIVYCANRQCVEDEPTNFCIGCTLYDPPESGEDDPPFDMWILAKAILKLDLQVEDGIEDEYWLQSRPRAITLLEKFIQKEDEENWI